MALSREQKDAIVAEITELLNNSKIVVFANYEGLGVSQAQELRAKAKENGTKVKVVKTRLLKHVMSQVDGYKDANLDDLHGQLVYAFNNDDEVAPAQLFAQFAKENPALELTGAISQEGEVMDMAQVNQLASLPSKDQLRGQLVGTIAAPLTGFVTVMSGNMRGLVNVLNARVQELES